LTPIYVCTKKVPQSYAVGNGDMMTFSETSAFWLFNRTTHLAYLFYDRVAPVLRQEIEDHQDFCQEQVAKTDAMAVKMLNAGNRKMAIDLISETSNKLAEKMFNRWKELENDLLVKYMDGNIKRVNEDGSYVTRPDTKIPSVEQPQQRETWLRAIVNDRGETLKVVQPKK
ncbi:MAG: dipeptidase, partial [Bacteroidales bacterium]|nr:dipeptidase [Bacteroidales bacterium]